MAVRVLGAAFLVHIAPHGSAGAYYGKLIGAIETQAHDLTGNVYAASETSVVITDLNYDGKGPAAHFWAGENADLDDHGDELLDEHGSSNVLKAYSNALVLLRLPKKITAYRCLGMYCKKFRADFGNVKIPRNYTLPTEQSLGKLSAKGGGIMAIEVVLRDSAIMLLKAFQYDGHCPSASFVAAPTVQPKQDDLTHLVYDGYKTGKLGRFYKTDVTVQLPKGHNWNEFKWFSVYCTDTKESYADIAINKSQTESVPVHDPKSYVPPCARNSGTDITALSVPTTLCLSTLVAAFAARRGLVFLPE